MTKPWSSSPDSDGTPRVGWNVGRIATIALPVALALAISALVLTPASTWHRPVNDATYSGFDPNTIFVTARGPGSADGIIAVSPQTMSVTALAGSHPTVHLVTSPLTFTATFDVVVSQATGGSVPFRVGIWSPSSQGGFYLVFDPASGNRILTRVIENGQPAQDLVGGTVTHEEVLGQFVYGQIYHVTVTVDKAAGAVSFHVSNPIQPPAGNHVVQIGTQSSDVTAIDATAVNVKGSTHYALSGWADHASGNGTFAIGIRWFDKAGRLLAPNQDMWWRGPSAATGWTQLTSDVVSPAAAVTARAFLGVGAQSTYLFGRVSFSDAKAGVNLLTNGSFDNGTAGWTTRLGGSASVITATLSPLDATSRTTARQYPVVAAFRPTLTVSAWSISGSTRATVSNFVVTLPSQPGSAAEEASRVADPVAQVLTVLLVALATLFLGAAGILGMSRWWPQRRQRIAEIRKWLAAPFLQARAIIFLLACGSVIYLLLNSSLFRIASPHFDLVSSREWVYIATRDGLSDLYYRTLIVPAAEAWNGVPWHEAVFSYGITHAYYYLGVGWIYQWFLSPSGSVDTNTFSLEQLLKALNIVFAIMDAALIYLILGRVVPRSTAAWSAVLFALNPALIFVMSVWGTTESLSIFFVLAAIWLAAENRPTLAWTMLGIGAFTRPQMFVFAFLIGCALVARFGILRSLTAIAWTTIVCFLLLAPFAFSISPSLPVDYIAATINYHFANGQADVAYQGTSAGYYSVWTILLDYVNGQHGLDRMWSSSSQILVGNLTYSRIGTIASTGFVAFVGLLLLVAPRRLAHPGRFLPIVAFGIVGWLVLTPGLISRYYIYGIAAVVICRPAFKLTGYLAIVGSLTVITLLTSFGHIALDFLGYGTVTSVISPQNNVVSQALFTMFADDRVITIGAVLNILALAVLGAKAWRSFWPRRSLDRVPMATASSAG